MSPPENFMVKQTSTQLFIEDSSKIVVLFLILLDTKVFESQP